MGSQRHVPAALTSGKRPGTHCTRSWVDPRASMDGTESLAHTRIGSPGRQPVASLSTDYAIPVRPCEIYGERSGTGPVLPPVLWFFRVNVISPMLHNHLHLNTALIICMYKIKKPGNIQSSFRYREVLERTNNSEHQYHLITLRWCGVIY